ncbi:hypothetical protein ZOSMA_15G00530 [Zostera marina]|uniref:Neprosin PEP catalytic domain-containing protein n=1 Tax=Zostera marina TaxID=29655 RepID=A0A0K9PWY8_ZOSMR|nr:hypothetical protein ZOSMA_15G00530 [Zostera marina]
MGNSEYCSQFLFFVVFLLVLTVTLVVSEEAQANDTFLLNLKRLRSKLGRINKPSIKEIQSPDGDLIDCVPLYLQPAFDHPMLKGHKPLRAPKRPKGLNSTGVIGETFQTWTISGESCSDGTIPIRRTKEEDLLRASSIKKYGRKPKGRIMSRDISGISNHEHAIGYITRKEVYGAKASINVWAPKVAAPSEFSLSQIWIMSGLFSNDLNTIEAGWQVSPELYGDHCPRFFIYWTSDAYRETGCYNLLCSGFIQIDNRIAMGASISPLSTMNGGQFDINIMIWKDPKHGHWWLEFGKGLIVGYWPSFLFSHLTNHASMVQFGGEIVNTQASDGHTSTQMGSGHFAGEGFRRAAYFRNLEAVDWDNNLFPASKLQIFADRPQCYDIRKGRNAVWGNYFYYGGSGSRNIKCT